MFCSMCGADGQSANAYCKRCGEWLSASNARSRGAFGGETPQQNIFTGLFMSALSTFAALFSAIALYATYLGGGDAKWSAYVAAAFCLCIAGWQASSFVVNLRLQRRLRRAREESASVSGLDAPRSRAALNAGDVADFASPPRVLQPPLSITEPTT